MPLSIKQLTEFTRHLSIGFTDVDGTIELDYRPIILTNTEAAEYDTKLQDGNGYEGVCVILPRWVAKWDITDKPGGKVLPITRDAFDALPSKIVFAIYSAIMEDINVHPLRSPASKSSLSLVEKEAV